MKLIPWLDADRGRILVPSRLQEVQEGDSVELGVFGKYVDPKKTRFQSVSFVRTGANTKMIQQLTEFGQNLQAAGTNELAIANVIAIVITELQQKPVPEAYIGYALYDSDSVLYEQEDRASRNSPVDCFSEGPACRGGVIDRKARNKHEELVQKLAIKKDGYIETFLVNETSENVWFDQFRIMSTGPLIVQETHYDPWGVELSGLGYQYGGIKVNPYLYNSKEANGHLGVNLFDYGARMYDPAIGRWFVVDPLAEKARRQSPYNYALNNPLRYIDPDGMEAYAVQGTPVINEESDADDPLVDSVVDGEETTQEEDVIFSDGYNNRISLRNNTASIGLNGSYSSFSNKNSKNGNGQDKPTINLANMNSGQELADAIRNMAKSKRRNYLEELIDISTRLEGRMDNVLKPLGGPITNMTSGTRRVLGEDVKITIWLRTDLKGRFLSQNSDNQIQAIKVNFGKENPVNNEIYSNVIITNGGDKGMIRFELKNNPNFVIKLNNYLQGK